MNKSRYKYLDILKVIAMLYVCIYHFWSGIDLENADFLRKYLFPILSTCVPIFFTVNGALLLNKQDFHGDKHFEKMLVIFGQYYMWYVITTIVLAVKEGIDILSLGKMQMMNILLFMEPLPGIRLNHLWFIPALCRIYLVYPFLISVFRQEHLDRSSRLSIIVLMAVCYFLSFLLNDFNDIKMGIPYINRLSLSALYEFDPFRYYIGTMLVYFLTGGFLHKYRLKLEKIPTVVVGALILAGLSLSFLVVYIRQCVGAAYDAVFDGYDSTGTFLCTVGLFLLASKAEDRIPDESLLTNVIHIIGRNTMTIYYTHWLFGETVLLWLPLGRGFFWNLLSGGLMLTFGTLLGEVMRKIPVLKYLVHG